MQKLKAEWERTDWAKLRGVWVPDFNRAVVLVRAPAEDVAREVAAVAPGARWEKDVLGRRATLGERAALVYALRGHPWAGVVTDSQRAWPPRPGWERAASARLKAEVITYHLGKTAGVRGYALYVGGEEQEAFAAGGAAGVEFRSKLRQVRAADIRDPARFIDDFLRGRDALDAGLTFDYFLRPDALRPGAWEPGQERAIGNPGFPLAVGVRAVAITRPSVERVDLVTAGAASK